MDTKKKPVVGINRWNLAGTVLKKVEKYSGSGALVTSIYLKVPSNNPKYSSQIWLKAFNSTKDESKNTADKVASGVEEGKNYSFNGYIKVGSYEKEGKKIYTQDFVINKFEDAVAQETETTGGASDEEVPF